MVVACSVSALPRLGSRTKSQKRKGDDDTGSGGDVEGHPPAEMLSQFTAHEIAEGSAHRDGEIEDA